MSIPLPTIHASHSAGHCPSLRLDSSPLGPYLWAESGSGPVVGGQLGPCALQPDLAALLEDPRPLTVEYRWLKQLVSLKFKPGSRSLGGGHGVSRDTHAYKVYCPQSCRETCSPLASPVPFQVGKWELIPGAEHYPPPKPCLSHRCPRSCLCSQFSILSMPRSPECLLFS